MDLFASIASLSVSLSQDRVRQDLGVAVLRKERDTQSAAIERLLQGISAPVLPDHLGRHVNIRV